MLYVIPGSVGELIVIVPVETEQIGCPIETVGTEGVGGCTLTRTLVAPEIQAAVFFAVKLYAPAAMFVKMPVVFV
jgi:hypothetical protein